MEVRTKKDDELTPWKSFSSSVQQDNMIVIHSSPVFKYQRSIIHSDQRSIIHSDDLPFSFSDIILLDFRAFIRNSSSAALKPNHTFLNHKPDRLWNNAFSAELFSVL